MESRLDALFLERRHQTGTLLQGLTHKIVHMSVIGSVVRDVR